MEILPAVHGRQIGFGSVAALRHRLLEFRPHLICIESDSTELYQAHQHPPCELSMSLEPFPFKTCVLSIDASQKTIRRRLGHRLISHPAEFFRLLLSPSNVTVDSLLEARKLRLDFQKKFPIAADILFDHREQIMAAAVRFGVADWRRATFSVDIVDPLRVAVIVGAAHADALAQLLKIQSPHDSQAKTDLSVLVEAWKTSVPSAVPIVMIFYVILPLFLVLPCSLYMINRQRDEKNGTFGEEA